jgi:hypothetical protein
MSIAPQPAAPHDQSAVIEVVRASRGFAVLIGALLAVRRAAETSLAGACMRSLQRPWRVASGAERLRAGALTLATAVVVHITMNATLGDTAGRYWLAIPIAVLLLSVLLFVASRDFATKGKAL